MPIVRTRSRYSHSKNWTDDLDAVVLYFESMGVNLEGIQRLLTLKCDIWIPQHQIFDRLEDLKNRYQLKGHGRVGQYLHMVMPDSRRFEELIRFGDPEEQHITINISLSMSP